MTGTNFKTIKGEYGQDIPVIWDNKRGTATPLTIGGEGSLAGGATGGVGGLPGAVNSCQGSPTARRRRWQEGGMSDRLLADFACLDAV
jgi:hypothetical protein